MKWQWCTVNPVRGVERNQEHKRKRYLKPDELARLTDALNECDDQQGANIVRMCLLTGARSGEVMAARWDQFDLVAGTWTKAASDVKQKAEHIVPLSAAALELLNGISITDKWVFPSRAGQHRSTIQKTWRNLCADAEIDGVRIHDLRHTFASILASAGQSLPIIGSLLGHSQPATTARYAHLFDDPLRKATETVGAIVSGKPSAEVIKLRRGV
jgi:integrase